MNFWQFIAEVIHYVAWPAIILVVVLLFRKHIEALLKSRMKVRHKDIEIEFNIPSELQSKMVKKVKLSDVNKDTLTWEHYLDALEHWAFELGIKLSMVAAQHPSAKDIKVMKYELDRLKTIVKKIEISQPNSTIIRFASDVFAHINNL